MTEVFMADLAAMQKWAEGIIASRPPDFVIGERYIRRWWILPRNAFCNVYLHEMLASDEDRALHDHPWPNTSVILLGSYIEHTPEGAFERVAGDVVSRPAEALHRLELVGERAISLFATGPKLREWGFECGHGWVHWKDFIDSDDPGQVGRGCGEPGALAPVTPVGEARAEETSDATA